MVYRLCMGIARNTTHLIFWMIIKKNLKKYLCYFMPGGWLCVIETTDKETRAYVEEKHLNAKWNKTTFNVFSQMRCNYYVGLSLLCFYQDVKDSETCLFPANTVYWNETENETVWISISIHTENSHRDNERILKTKLRKNERYNGKKTNKRSRLFNIPGTQVRHGINQWK